MIILTEPLGAELITGMIIRSIQFERNPQRGQVWADIYLEYGYMHNEIFCACVPSGLDSPIIKLRFENGCHPARDGSMLGKCDTCGAWALVTSGPCKEGECRGMIAAHPTFVEFSTKLSSLCTNPMHMWAAVEEILTLLQYPSLDNAEIVGPLISAGTVVSDDVEGGE